MNTFLLVLGALGITLSILLIVAIILAWSYREILEYKELFVYLVLTVAWSFLCVMAHTKEGVIKSTCVERGSVVKKHQSLTHFYSYRVKNGCIKEQNKIFIDGKWHNIIKKEIK